jgi:hypothetical protein
MKVIFESAGSNPSGFEAASKRRGPREKKVKKIVD